MPCLIIGEIMSKFKDALQIIDDIQTLINRLKELGFEMLFYNNQVAIRRSRSDYKV